MKPSTENAPDTPLLTEAEWQPESPFSSFPTFQTQSLASQPRRETVRSYEMESPFLSEYQLEGGEPAVTPQMQLFASLLAELHDSEFDEAVTDLVNEAAVVTEERYSFETGDPVQQRMEAEQGLRDYFAPLERESQAMLDRMIAGIGETDLHAMTESELEFFLDRLAPTDSSLTPAFSNFVGKLFDKAKKVVKGVKGLVEKVSPVHIVLKKLKSLVRPLLQRVLQSAINKLPAAVRPVAAKLAKHFTGPMMEAEAPEAAGAGEATAVNPASFQAELDTLLAGYMVEGETFDRIPEVAQFMSESEEGPSDQIRDLDRARTDFARNIVTLGEGEDPAPVVERFVPAILAAAKIAIKVVGRPRVVNFIANLVSKLIVKYVGQQQSVALSRALVDTGLKLVGLETPSETPSLAAGYTLASTVEETLNQVAASAPETVWESEALLEAYVREAFEKAASANFPDSHIRPDLREGAEVSGAWILMPAQSNRKRYKKYTRVLNATISPQVASTITTFGGASLAQVFRDQLRLSPNSSVTARVHIYEAIPGTTLSLISFHEKGVPGLGHARRDAWSFLHPLTPEAAGLLLKEPGLGRKVPERFLVDRNLIDVGQRLYYLDIPEARIRPAPGPTTVPHMTQTGLVFDFPRGQLRVFLYYSEADAQHLAKQLRNKAPAGVLMTALKVGIEVRLSTILSGNPNRGLRLIHEAVPAEQFAGAAIGAGARMLLRAIGEKLVGMLAEWILNALKQELEQRYERFASEFARAAETDADGVTVIISYQQPSFFEQMRRMLTTGALLAAPALAAMFAARKPLGDFSLEIRPGFARW